MRTFFRFLLLVAAVFGLAWAEGDDQAERLAQIQALQSEIVVLTARAQALEDTIQRFVEEARADGEFTEDELQRIEELTAQAEELSAELEAKIEELESLREDVAEEGTTFRSLFELLRLLDEAYSFVYVSAGELDPRFAAYLSKLHPALLRNSRSPRFPIVKYAEQFYPLVPGVAVLTTEDGWPLSPPPPFMPALFVQQHDIDTRDPRWTQDLMGQYSPFPVVAVVKGEVPEPPILFFDRISLEHQVSYINIPITVAGQKITIPIPWRIVPKVEYRIYTVSTPLISEGVFDPERSTYSYIKNTQESRNKILGPFMDALYRSPPYAP
ncbi:hypothetical protein Ocepr_2341 (plasmid) [Oceanithermus profundus DSM 14977]|uniref:Uncharacterized protein n=1 Tax=Oceanithermus profundus (strain DSM 14977 / NBRC 100410 / VKM B-2274 / 506) TaxID=670487 RepID=E4UAL0_OCEP5|nr:hypothetical protein [Oceanithermus profundus]ADR37789.1 hypothetical protein Ocepr_2341 [Oceanithermus profundus DSM 14977]